MRYEWADPQTIYALAAEADERDNMELLVRLPEEETYQPLLLYYSVPQLLCREFFRLAEENRMLKDWRERYDSEARERIAALEAEIERLKEQWEAGKEIR